MTSFIIKSHVNRPSPYARKEDTTCTFCRIVQDVSPATKIYEDDNVLAFLDIMPLRRGHTLVVPKIHMSRLSELPTEYAAALGVAVSKVARALTEATENSGLNVVCNQEYAQAVPHVHYHIIPAPTFGSSSASSISVSDVSEAPWSEARKHMVQEMHQMEFEARGTLDRAEAEELAVKIRARL